MSGGVCHARLENPQRLCLRHIYVFQSLLCKEKVARALPPHGGILSERVGRWATLGQHLYLCRKNRIASVL